MGFDGGKATDDFFKALKEGKVSPEFENVVRSLSQKHFANFRTASSTLAMSRNIFSKLFFWNARAGYLINRAGDVQYAVEKAARHLAEGKPFHEILRDNEEFRTLIINTLLSAKMATYADRFYDDYTEEGKADRVVGFWNGLNDYYAALTSNMPLRMLVAPISDTMDYVRFMDAHGQEVTVGRGLAAGAYGYLNEMVRALFREAQILDPLMESGKAALLGSSLDTVFATFETHWDRVSNASARFSLMDGNAPYGLVKFKEPTDYFNSLLMTVGEGNDSMKRYSQLREVENLEKLFQDPGFAILSLMLSVNGIPKWLADAESSNGELDVDLLPRRNAGQVLDKLRDEMAKDDSIMKNLYAGQWDPRVVDSKNFDSIYKDMVSLDMPSMALGPDGLKAANNYGLNVAKKEAFEAEMLKLIDKDDLLKKVTALNTVGEERTAGLVELLAYSDAKVPGSSRLMLSYLTNKFYTGLNQKYLAEKGHPNAAYEFTDKLIPAELQEANKKAAINAFMPAMYVADKQSWYNNVYERVQQKYPEFLKFDNKAQQSFFASVGLLDLIAHGEALSGNPDAKYVKNVFAFTGKYVNDPVTRMMLGVAAMDSIDATAPHPDVAAAAKLGFVAGNVEIIDRLVKDPVMMARHGKEIGMALDKIFGTVGHLNSIGSENVQAEISAADQKRYGLTRGSSYVPKKYSSSNDKVKSQVQDRLPSILKNLPSGYTPSNVTRYDTNPYSKYEAFGNRQMADWYATVYARALGVAKTDALVTGYVNRFPGDTEKDSRFTLSKKATQVPKQKSQYFQPKRARYAYKKNAFEG